MKAIICWLTVVAAVIVSAGWTAEAIAQCMNREEWSVRARTVSDRLAVECDGRETPACNAKRTLWDIVETEVAGKFDGRTKETDMIMGKHYMTYSDFSFIGDSVNMWLWGECSKTVGLDCDSAGEWWLSVSDDIFDFYRKMRMKQSQDEFDECLEHLDWDLRGLAGVYSRKNHLDIRRVEAEFSRRLIEMEDRLKERDELILRQARQIRKCRQ